MALEGGELDWETMIDGSSTALHGGELVLRSGNSASSPSVSGNPLKPPTAGAQSRQFSGQGEGGSSKKEGQTSTKIKVSGNKQAQTISNLFNNTFRPNNNFEGEITDNTTRGGLTNIGNGSPYQGSKKRTKKKSPPTSSRAAEKEVGGGESRS